MRKSLYSCQRHCLYKADQHTETQNTLRTVLRNPLSTTPPLKFYCSSDCKQRSATVLLLLTLCIPKDVVQGSIVSDTIYLPRRKVNIWEALEHTGVAQLLGIEYCVQMVWIPPVFLCPGSCQAPWWTHTFLELSEPLFGGSQFSGCT